MAAKRRDLTVLEKLDLLQRYDSLGRTSQRDAAGKLGISQPLLCKLLQSREALQAVEVQNGRVNRKRSRQGKASDVEEALLLWFTHARDKKAPLTREILVNKASQLATELGVENFNPTDGWLTRWKDRNNIVHKKMHGESQHADQMESQRWIAEVLPNLLLEYAPTDIFNADETALYYRAIPDATLAFKNEKVAGGKKQKARLTVLLACNMTGSEKKRPLIIGKSMNPRCFRGVKNLPLAYKANQNAWMTRSLFTDFLKEWDRDNRIHRRRICLLVDNCTAHPTDIPLTNIKIIFLPANTTSLIQPLDQGIIRALKAHYRRLLLQRLIVDIDCNKPVEKIAQSVSVLDAMHFLANAWECISSATVANCFRKAGFAQSLDYTVAEEEVPAPVGITQDEFSSWVNIDDNLPVAAELTDTEIVQQVRAHHQEIPGHPTAELDSDDEEVRPLPSSKDVHNALQILRTTLDLCGGTESEYRTFYTLERSVQRLRECSLVQSTLDNFLQPSL